MGRLLSARGGLSPTKRRKITIAHAEKGSSMCVDGPMLARSLRRFLENALEAAFNEPGPSLVVIPIDYRENELLTKKLGEITCTI